MYAQFIGNNVTGSFIKVAVLEGKICFVSVVGGMVGVYLEGLLTVQYTSL
jgi:hypothetical protein